MELIVADIGGTHARFAIAEVAGGRVVRLGEPVTVATQKCEGLLGAWRQVGERLGHPLPRAAALAAASPHGAADGRLTRDIWTMSPAEINRSLDVDTHLILNDFGAVAHAVQHASAGQFLHLCGPDLPLPDSGVVTVCGPGTGIGCAQLIRRERRYDVVETEGGHIGFAPADAYEDALVARLREWHGRASAERVCAGPAILAHLQTVADEEGSILYEASERLVWEWGLDPDQPDPLSDRAIERFCMALGAVAGDLALAQGAKAVVIAGGLGLRLRERLLRPGFVERFVAKGRFQELMKGLPVKLITHPQPGLFGAAAAFASAFPLPFRGEGRLSVSEGGRGAVRLTSRIALPLSRPRLRLGHPLP